MVATGYLSAMRREKRFARRCRSSMRPKATPSAPSAGQRGAQQVYMLDAVLRHARTLPCQRARARQRYAAARLHPQSAIDVVALLILSSPPIERMAREMASARMSAPREGMSLYTGERSRE